VGDVTSDPFGSILIGAMWWYASNVLYPAQTLKHAGIPISNEIIGNRPRRINKQGLGPHFSLSYSKPVLLSKETTHDHLVDDFNSIAAIYSSLVLPFSQPIFDEALRVMYEYVPSDARVLDAGCGPGIELQRIAQLLPNGEIVGIDLSAEMVKTAFSSSLENDIRNCAFFQADVGNLPQVFTGRFDVVYSCLAHHHYPKPLDAARSILRCLRPGGIYFVIDAGPAWYIEMSSTLGKLADPGWIGIHTPEQFRALLTKAGFSRTGWFDILPGYGVATAQKAANSNSRPKEISGLP
jgi:SAM-dependent methyltransferase